MLLIKDLSPEYAGKLLQSCPKELKNKKTNQPKMGKEFELMFLQRNVQHH